MVMEAAAAEPVMMVEAAKAETEAEAQGGGGVPVIRIGIAVRGIAIAVRGIRIGGAAIGIGIGVAIGRVVRIIGVVGVILCLGRCTCAGGEDAGSDQRGTDKGASKPAGKDRERHWGAPSGIRDPHLIIRTRLVSIPA